MKKEDILKKYRITEGTLNNWKKLKYIEQTDDIDSKIVDKILKDKNGNRRNKKNSLEKIIPVSYVNDIKIIDTIKQILQIQSDYKISLNKVLHEVILRILNKSNLKIPKQLSKILGTRTKKSEIIYFFDNLNIDFADDNDFLGCLYMSLLSVGKKDVNGIFYTPYSVVNQIIEKIDFQENSKVLDPGCGSGNFLLQAYKAMKSANIPPEKIISNLYGYDIDEIAVLLAKINIYILDKEVEFDKINIYKMDFLIDKISQNFDIVIGNPPWGKKYTNEEKQALKEKYNSVFCKMDSYAQFIFCSFNILNEHGNLCFVLPSSILNIETHEEIRKVILQYDIESIDRIGRKFEEIVTDVIIIKIKKESNENHKCRYDNAIVNQNEFKNNPYYNFLMIDNISMNIIKKLKNYQCYKLEEDVEFALGIVTGNNNKYITEKKTKENEPIISGKEIDKYSMNYAKINKFITFNRQELQQVAKEELYRSKNKIIYKFIGKKLCFAIENRGVLTLNSANLLILGERYNIYYISAILNSRITQLYFEDTYNTHKVLKNHIQSFLMPNFRENVVNEIAKIVKEVGAQDRYCEKIEDIIYRELNLSEKEIEYIKNRF